MYLKNIKIHYIYYIFRVIGIGYFIHLFIHSKKKTCLLVATKITTKTKKVATNKLQTIPLWLMIFGANFRCRHQLIYHWRLRGGAMPPTPTKKKSFNIYNFTQVLSILPLIA